MSTDFEQVDIRTLIYSTISEQRQFFTQIFSAGN
jgi:hypothetical protein